MQRQPKEPKLIPFKQVVVTFARQYILRRVYQYDILTPKEARKMYTILKRIERAIIHLLHIKSLVEKILNRHIDKKV